MFSEHTSSADISLADKLFRLLDRHFISQFRQRRLQQTFNLFLIPFPNAYFWYATFNVVSTVHSITLRTSTALWKLWKKKRERRQQGSLRFHDLQREYHEYKTMRQKHHPLSYQLVLRI